MAEVRFDVVGIGNAIVDVLCQVDDAFLADHGLTKGVMTLIDPERAQTLYGAMGASIEASGGSAGNTMAAVAALGGRAAFIGKVADDQLGDIYAHDISAAGVTFERARAESDIATGCSLIVVTPDAERTMNTYLGAAEQLQPEDIDPDVIAAAKVTYMEGYLWDKPGACEAFLKAMRIAHEHGRQVSLSLSDIFCVERHRADFLDLVQNRVDILFANEEELKSLYRTGDWDVAIEAVRGRGAIAAITRSEHGSIIVTGEGDIAIEPEAVARLVDSTGAGDLYAAGFLFALTRGDDLASAGRLGSIAAAEVLQHLGPRPQSDLKQIAAALI